MASIFASLKLPKLEKCILEDSCMLEFSCKDFNVRTLQLKSEDGKILLRKGFTFIPCLEGLEQLVGTHNENVVLDNKTPFVYGIVDTKLDSCVRAGAKLTVQKSSSGHLLATLEDGDINLLLQREDTNLALLLDKIEIELMLL